MRDAALSARVGRLLALVGALLALAPSRVAAQATLDLFDGDVRVVARTAWPDGVRQGWLPVRVRAVNDGERSRSFELDLETQDWGSVNTVVTRPFELAPGEVVELELLAPVLEGAQRSLHLAVSAGTSSWWSSDIATFAPDEDLLRTVALLRRDEVPAALAARWAASVSPGTISVRGTTRDQVAFGVVPFDEASEAPEAYTSLDLVLVSTEHGPPPRGVAAALRAWVELGGEVAFLGPDARQAAARSGFEPWLEPRFDLGGAGTTWRAGHGRVHVEEGPAPSDAAGVPGVGRWQARLRRDAERPGLATLREVRPADRFRWLTIADLERLPVRGYLFLLLGFALLIGPVNFLVVTRVWKRPPLLLVTIPVIAVVATAVILGLGVVMQGVATREAVLSSSLLDQREHVVATLERRSLFAGLSPGPGLRPAAGTAVFGWPDPTLGGERDFRVVVDDAGLLLRGEYLPPRRLARLGVAARRAARGGLDVARAGDGLRASNALEAGVGFLAVRDPDGAWFLADGPLAPGGDAVLSASTRAEVRSAFEQAVRVREPDALEAGGLSAARLDLVALRDVGELWAGGYVALLDRDPLRDSLGVDAETDRALHVLFGVLPLDAGAWR